jgi:FixJ family two-component response regulator
LCSIGGGGDYTCEIMSSAPLIAVVDDDTQVRTALSRILSAFNFRVVAFASGRAFLKSVGAQRPDCVLLDLHMPELSGHDVQQQLTAARIQLPIVVITGEKHPGARNECLAAGAIACLAKPVLPEALIAAVNLALTSAAGFLPSTA